LSQNDELAESVNGHLNAEIFEGQNLMDRVVSISKHFLTCYRSPNTWRDRAVRRNWDRSYLSEGSSRSLSDPETKFYQHLHDAFGKDPEQRNKEKLPAEERREFLSAVYTFLTRFHSLRRRIRMKKFQGAIDGETRPDSIPLPQKSGRTARGRTAWDIAWDFQKHLGPGGWQKYAQQINIGIIEIAVALGIPEEQVPYKMEAAWPNECWNSLDKWTK
jgi:hypothetical protein